MTNARSLKQLRAYQRQQGLEHDLSKMQLHVAHSQLIRANEELSSTENLIRKGISVVSDITKQQGQLDLAKLERMSFWLTNQEQRCDNNKKLVTESEANYDDCLSDLAQIIKEREAISRVKTSWTAQHKKAIERIQDSDLEDLWLGKRV